MRLTCLLSLLLLLGCDGDGPTRPDSGGVDGGGDDAGDGDAGPRSDGGDSCGALAVTDLGIGGLTSPVQLTAPDGDARMFVGELPTGRVQIVEGGAVTGTFLDLSAGSFQFAGDLGLNGVAFHPQYPTDGRVFVAYAPARAVMRVSSFSVSATDPNAADPSSEVTILEATLPEPSHSAGHLAFGNDGFLYVSIGDGQAGGDAMGVAQDTGSLLGKILRVDVDGAAPYTVPTDNPFVGMAPAAEEVWLYGFRVPYRFSFDPMNGDFYLGEVGDGGPEEINFVASGGEAGGNYGWPTNQGSAGCTAPGCTPPIAEFAHSGGLCAVMGGFVYRGSTLDSCHQGRYFYADYCTGQIFSFRVEGGAATDMQSGPTVPEMVVSWGRDGAGELYLLGMSGAVFALQSM